MKPLIVLIPSWFQNVILANRACGGGITAWKGANLTDAPGNKYGAYISESQIIRVRSFCSMYVCELGY